MKFPEYLSPFLSSVCLAFSVYAKYTFISVLLLYRSSNFPERRKLIQRKAKKKFAKTLRRNESTGCSSETESSDYSDNNFETSEYVDDVYDNRFNSDGSDDPKKSGGSGTDSERCCNGYPYYDPNDSDY